MTFNIIVAHDIFTGIGKNNKLPWPHIKDDMKRFTDVTVGNGNNAVVMGRKTYESLPERHRPLKKRDNYIISRSLTPSEHVFNNFEQVKQLKDKYDEVWIIGGEEIYIQAVKELVIHKIFITFILQDFKCDRIFDPTFNKLSYNSKSSPIFVDKDTQIRYVFIEYTLKTK